MENILLILPYEDMRDRLSALLARSGYAWRSDRMPEEFAARLRSFVPDLAVLDEQLPADEIEAWSRVITGLSPNTRLLDISRYPEAERRTVVSAHGYVEEPFEDDDFLSTVRRVLAAKKSPEPTLPRPS
jgi:DNA-binding NtrC family response regulator